jgi:hypothetical protein
MQPETTFKRRIRPLLEALPSTRVLKIQQLAIRGCPDFLLSVRGRFVAIELKISERAHLAKLQRYELSRLAATGAFAFVIYPQNWGEFYPLIRAFAEREDGAEAALREFQGSQFPPRTRKAVELSVQGAENSIQRTEDRKKARERDQARARAFYQTREAIRQAR